MQKRIDLNQKGNTMQKCIVCLAVKTFHAINFGASFIKIGLEIRKLCNLEYIQIDSHAILRLCDVTKPLSSVHYQNRKHIL